MDTFIDKLAEKRNAQEIIRANMAAEAAKVGELENQIRFYDELMKEIRQVNLKTAENASRVQDALRECIAKLESVQENMQAEAKKAEAMQETEAQETFAQLKELLEEKFKQADEFLHKENVKVYRNVQAAVVEELSKQTQELKDSQEEDKGSRLLLPISIMILIGLIANIVIQLFSVTITL